MANVNNLNIFTFIKDIYQSLKNIDKTLNLSIDKLNTRIDKLEENQQILIDKNTTIELLLSKLSENSNVNSGLDKTLEYELLEKMKHLNQNDVNNNKLSLLPNELTFANIVENDYTFNDINESIGNNEILSIENHVEPVDTNTTNTNTTNTTNNSETLDSLLF
jgi:hypothetical protein